MKIHSHVNSFTVFFYSSGNMVQSKLLLMNIEYFNQCVSSRRSCSVQLLQHYWSGIDLDYCDIEWFALETKRDHSVVFEIASKYCSAALNMPANLENSAVATGLEKVSFHSNP